MWSSNRQVDQHADAHILEMDRLNSQGLQCSVDLPSDFIVCTLVLSVASDDIHATQDDLGVDNTHIGAFSKSMW